MKQFYLLLVLILPFSILSCREDSFIDKYSSDSAYGILDIGEDIRFYIKQLDAKRAASFAALFVPRAGIEELNGSEMR